MSAESVRVGRENDIALIRKAADQVARRRAQVVYIEGFAGVGKRTVLREALAPLEGWREITVVLDKEQSCVSGDLLRRLVLPADAPLRGQGVDELVAQGLKRAEGLRRPTVITLVNVHWIDSESAEALLRICTMLRDAAVLVVMCGHPSSRTTVNWLTSFARNSPHASYARVDPFRPAETKALLAQHLTTPLSEGVISAVQRETCGYPLLIEELGKHLAASPIGRRRLATSLSAVKAGSAAQRVRRGLDEALDPLADETRAVLKLLAVSSAPLTRHQISCALGTSADLSDVLESGLAVWDEQRFGYRIRNRLITEVLLEGMYPNELVEVQRRLIGLLDSTQALAHRVDIARVLPAAEPVAELIVDLRAAADDSMRRGDLEHGFQRFLDVAMLRPDAQALQDILHLGVPLGHLDCFTQFESAIRRLFPGPLRQAGLALVALDRGDLHKSVTSLERQSRVDAADAGALVYAHAVALVAAQLSVQGIQGIPGQVQRLKAQTVSMLGLREEDLGRRLEEQGYGGLPREALEWERAHAAGLRAFIRLWLVLDQQDPRRAREAEEDISREIERLEKIPNSEVFQVGLRAVRGARLRQIGDPVRAYADLSGTLAVSADLSFLTYAKAQLAQVLFMDGMWEDSQDVSAAAADRALLGCEDATALVAYLTWALIPVSRGHYDDVAPLVSEITAVRKEAGALVSAALDYLHAWNAVVHGDHGTTMKHLLRMRDESGGWWNAGIDSLLLLVRAAHHAGSGSLIPGLRRSVVNGDSPVRTEFQSTVTNYMGAFEAWGSHDPAAAMGGFLRVCEWLDAQPSLHPGQQMSGSGGYRLFKALAFLDMGALVVSYPHELKRHRSGVIEGLEWAASVFTSVGSPGLIQLAAEELAALRPRLAGAAPRRENLPRHPATRGGVQLHPRPEVLPELAREDVATEHAGPLEGLSARERQVVVLIADGWTNKEIAEELIVSVRTVDFHVRNALAKFDVSSRHDIRQRLRGGVRRV